MIDAQIATRLKNRDKRALGDLFNHYGAGFYGQALRILQSETLAQKAVEAAFLRIWHTIDQFDESKGRLFTWMYRIARDEAMIMKRTRDKSLPEASTMAIEFINATEDDTVIGKDDFEVVDQLLNRLDDESKNMLASIYFRGNTQSEFARTTGTSVAEIRIRLRKAILKLRSFLV
jgi:RNA polymerase sigma factor (sigma-70 family)